MAKSKPFTGPELTLVLDNSKTSAEVAGLTGRSIRSIDTKRYSLRKSEKMVKRPEVDRSVDHAQARATWLSGELTKLTTGSRYPLVNPEALVVESYRYRTYDRKTGAHAYREGTPRTSVSDTLRVAPIDLPAGRRFIFTGAQNDTPVHRPFWENLQAYASHIGAEIAVGPWTYETQWWSENNPTARNYAPELLEYLCFGQMKIGPNFVFCGEMNTLPTANRPVSDLVSYSRGRWAVFPHARLQLRSVPSTDPTRQAHQVMTTGAVTCPKVIPRKAGIKSIFHHVLGATVVEFDETGNLFCRQISASKDGSFYDLDTFTANGLTTLGHRARAVVFGDLHSAKLDGSQNLRISLGAGSKSVLSVLKPELAILHDIHDQEIASHHNVNDCGKDYELAVRGRTELEGEIRKSLDILNRLRGRDDLRVLVIESNHDLALERYIREGRYRKHGLNMSFGLKLDAAYTAWRGRVGEALDAKSALPKFSVLEYAIRDMQPKGLEHVSWVYDGTSYLVDGIEVGHHGFRGCNGAKGTVPGFANIGRRISIGDKHSPEILDGVYTAGVMELQHGYNKGPSGWGVAHIVQYPNGKRTLITLQNGKWRA